jgi:ABC-2 type transport system ATP-binding protein
LKLWVKDPDASAFSLAAGGFEVNVASGVLHVKIEEHWQIKEILEMVDPIDLRLVEPTLGDAFLRLAEEVQR